MERIFHISSIEDWQKAQQTGAYRDKSLVEEGFIHNSTWRQVGPTLARHFQGKTDLILLEIDPTSISSLLKYEEAHGELYPHIYGEIPLQAIVATRKIPLENP